jgi:hypothetical protein
MTDAQAIEMMALITENLTVRYGDQAASDFVKFLQERPIPKTYRGPPPGFSFEDMKQNILRDTQEAKATRSSK